MTMTALRFVVLLHRVGTELQRTEHDHWDWMFQHGDVLRTWATSPGFDLSKDVQSNCQRIADHRLQYLDYQGPIRNDRGDVSQVITGTWTDIAETDPGANRFAARLLIATAPGTELVQRSAQVTFQRIVDGGSDRSDEIRGDWSFRWVPGR
ncbi:hypothetical protein K227x_01630 [Rubripirellula lacrimiformis]|uniref:DNA ligase D 3'-phosphoesterase domain-containing protein n=1 Tax=Rubripirellula lacrimiformis TaxID=1930273 RepID=A0A517N3T1_9BACT|nr:DNA polymerase ligase N-terminal domain-containing protein [Rubripirellula lacrimiformis]QDT01795.1 hypothetical protein K227x_01630 [Rubripirellula lacrimiformis]